MTDNFFYNGTELELFQNARNWKKYLRKMIKPYLNGRVLEVGAGIGTNTKYLCHDEKCSEWICLEPDHQFIVNISKLKETGELSANCTILEGKLTDLSPEDKFDSILYIDVLEHIAADNVEISLAANKLLAGGKLIVLCPAHLYLFSAFDHSIGHYRRYSISTLLNLTPPSLTKVISLYLDSFGLLASLGNRFFLNASLPSRKQILLWDRLLVPLSKLFDPLTNYHIGKSVLVVWEKMK